MKKILKFLFSRTFFFALGILLQLTILIFMTLTLSNYGIFMYVVFEVFSVITILSIVSRKDNPVYKLAWVLPVALFPLFGWLLFLLFGQGGLSRKEKRRMDTVRRRTLCQIKQSDAVMDELKQSDPNIHRQMNYLLKQTGMPICHGTESEYLSPGEDFFVRLCEELEKAEKFIFMEYFILEPGQMWDTVLAILARKAAKGVEVKLIYDDIGSLFTLPGGYQKKLRKMGIQAYAFNALRPSLDAFMNYRDHRKITVIDGNVGFTGGNNLADEYINACEKHGHWKDSSIMLKGEAVWNLSLLFLQIWECYDSTKLDYARYRPTRQYETDGYVTVFGDSPLDQDLVGEWSYMHIIQNAKKYVSITTPYLILDNEMITTLCSAAQSGIKVYIVTPAIADKWYVHMVTRYNYKTLVESGVKIFEYTGGFIHAKTLVCDDEIAVVGTQNFDFRSFYLHFECSALLYQSSTVDAVRKDHIAVMARSHPISIAECRDRHWTIRALQVILSLFAPLM